MIGVPSGYQLIHCMNSVDKAVRFTLQGQLQYNKVMYFLTPVII